MFAVQEAITGSSIPEVPRLAIPECRNQYDRPRTRPTEIPRAIPPALGNLIPKGRTSMVMMIGEKEKLILP